MSIKNQNYDDHNFEEIFEIDDPVKPDTDYNDKIYNVHEEKIEDDLNFTINLLNNYRIQIYKPLLPIKLILYFWYGTGSFVSAFLTVYFKQRGVTLTELSSVLSFSPIIQTLGAVLFGILSDKLGKSKPILVLNIFLAVLLLGSLLLIPKVNDQNCRSQPINLKCHPRQFDRLITKTTCDIIEHDIEIRSCNVQCPENVTDQCDGQNLICEILAGNEEMRNFSLTIHVGGHVATKNDRCYYNVSSMSHKNSTYSWCNVPHKMYCRVSCIVESGVQCSNEHNRMSILVSTMVLYILFTTVFSSCYRFLDITCMSLVTEHGADFGQQRLFGVLGIITISPIAGLIVDATSHSFKEKNYHSAFYFYIALIVFLLGLTFTLKVRIEKPGQRMGKKALKLVRNPDVVLFAIVVFILGTSWNYSKMFLFWYLEEMKSPSLLLGLIPAVGSLYGIPFLATSGWWVNKIGPHQIFVIAFLGYVINCTGYSFLQDPWFSLILEATTIFTYHLLWVAVVVHSHHIAPEGLTSTVIGMAGSLHYHFGKSLSGVVGAVIMSNFGGRIAFRVMAVICIVSAGLYALYLYARRSYFPIKLTMNNSSESAVPLGKEICSTSAVDECRKT